MEMIDKFTQEIKEKWLDALRSGKYIQGKTDLKKDDKHCCIGVLAEICGFNIYNDHSYNFLEKNLGSDIMKNIWQTNDFSYNVNKPDYSNVIPLIESLEVKE